MSKNQAFKLGQTLRFSDEDGHPESKIVGIDSYTFEAEDGLSKSWNSYTLIPINENDAKPPYDRWYAVDLPKLGMSFVQIIEQSKMPTALSPEPALTGKAVVETTGDGELGTGKSLIVTQWDKSVSPAQMYASEKFESGEVLYFKTQPISGLIR